MSYAASAHRIDRDDLHRWVASGEDILLIDLGSDPEPQLTGVASIRMKLHELPMKMCVLPKDGRIVVVCHETRRSAAATGYLRQEGFEAWLLMHSATLSTQPSELTIAVMEDR